MRKEQIIKDKFNKVTIYYWERIVVGFSRRIGHVSLRTHSGGADGNGYHMSIWPITPTKFFSRRGVPFVSANSLKDDIQHEDGYEPTREFVLYSLDVKKINTLYLKYRRSGFRWATLASTFLADPETCNCAELVRRLLIEGGIRKLETHENIATVAAGTLLSVFGIGGSVSICLPAKYPPFFVPKHSWSTFDDNAPPGYWMLNSDRILAMGLCFGLTLMGIKITSKANKVSSQLIAHTANIATLGIGFLAFGLANLGCVLEDAIGTESTDVAESAANYVFFTSLAAAGIAALSSSTLIHAFKLLDKSIITPNDIAKIAKYAQVSENVNYDLIDKDEYEESFAIKMLN